MVVIEMGASAWWPSRCELTHGGRRDLAQIRYSRWSKYLFRNNILLPTLRFPWNIPVECGKYLLYMCVQRRLPHQINIPAASSPAGNRSTPLGGKVRSPNATTRVGIRAREENFGLWTNNK